jgi:frataxin-like iron-binding protein CyaY
MFGDLKPYLIFNPYLERGIVRENHQVWFQNTKSPEHYLWVSTSYSSHHQLPKCSWISMERKSDSFLECLHTEEFCYSVSQHALNIIMIPERSE